MCLIPSSTPGKGGIQFIPGNPLRNTSLHSQSVIIGDEYFLNKLHEPACIKRKPVYYGAKVSGRRSRVQVVICPYCRLLSQNAPSGCSHIWRHWGLTFACGGCKKFHTEAPKKLQEHLGKCKEALAAKAAAELVVSQNETSKEEKE